MKALLPAALAGAALIVSLCASPVAVAAPCDLPLVTEQVLAQLNQVRSQPRRCGERLMPAVSALRWQPLLVDAAQRYAGELAGRGKLSHTALDGASLTQRMDQARYPMRAAGENLAAGPDSIDEVIGLWLGSPGHCENLMAPDFTEVGLACDILEDHRAQPYWVMELGRPRNIRPVKTRQAAAETGSGAE